MVGGILAPGRGRAWRLAGVFAVSLSLVLNLTPGRVPAAGLVPAAVLGWSPGVERGVPPGVPLTVYFNQPMDRASAERAWRLSPRVSGTFRWSGTALTYLPTRSLRPGTAYRLSIAASARGMTGSPATPFSVRFSTGDALRVVSYSPWNGTQGVPSSGPISVTFNHPMVPLRGLSAPAADPAGWRMLIRPRVAGHGSWLGTSTWIFHPDVGLRPSTRYAITLARTARDAWGESLARGPHWAFRTLTPELFSRSPRNGTQFVDPRASIRVTFNQLMDRISAARAFSVSRSGVSVDGAITWQGSTLIFHPSSSLPGDGTYDVAVSGFARSVNDQASLAKTARWSFRVAPTPRVTGTAPSPGKTSYAAPPPNPYNQGGGFPGPCCYTYNVSVNVSTPMDKQSLDHHLTIFPSVSRFDTFFGGPDSNGNFSYAIAGDFRPSSTYRVTIGNGVHDQFGRPLPGSYSFSFKTSRLYPSVALYGMPGRDTISFSAGQVFHAPIQLVNVPKVTYTLIRTNLYGLTARQGNVQPDGKVVRRWTATATTMLNKVQNLAVALAQKDGSALPPALYWLDAAAPDKVPGWPAFINGPPESSEVVAVTNVNVTSKSGANGTLVWVNGAQTGKGLAGASVRLTDYWGRAIVTAKTDSRGLHFFADHATPFAAVVNDGTHYGMAETYWQPNSSSPYFLPFLSYGYQGNQSSNGTYLYTDRPVYRPGQRVRFRGVLWNDKDGVYSLLGPRRVSIQALSAVGRPLHRETVTLDRYGAIHGSFLLPATTPTGNDNILVNIQGFAGVSTSFTVAEYRKPEFLTMVTAERASYAQGQTLRAAASVRYVFGTPTAHQQVSWFAYAQTRFPQPPGWDTYSFFDYEDFWQQTENVNPFDLNQGGGGQFGKQIASGTGRTDARGVLVMRLPVDLAKEVVDRTVTLEATAMDVNHQSVSGRVEVAEYKSDLAVGLSAEHETVPAGQPVVVDIAAVTQDGAAVPGRTLSATIDRRTYTSKLVDVGNHQSAWQSVPHDSPVRTQTLTSDSHGKVTLTFTPKEGGEYRVVVEGKDALGNPARNAISVYVSAEGLSDWGPSNDTSITLKPDRSTYRVGETAHILVPAPFDHATALITVERGNIRHYRVTQLATNSSVIDVPIRMDDIPNVYVTVTLYRGWRTNSPPDWRYGTSELHVRVDPKHLIVHLRQNGYRHHPGDPVTYEVTTTDAKGHHVSAQLSLALVDTSVLALQDENNPDILKALYAERQLGVSTASDGVTSVNHLATQPPFQIQGSGGGKYGLINAPQAGPARLLAGGGGGGPPPTVTVRSRFADTAYWMGNLVTDASGRGVVRLRLPDNATTWRLDARGVTAQQGVGQARLHTLATKDLVLRPVLPRFLSEGDRLKVGAVLNNNLAFPVRAKIQIGGRGLNIPRGATTSVLAPAHGERIVLWPASVPVAKRAVVFFRVVSLNGRARADAVRVSVPIHPPLTDETVATAGKIYGSVKQAIVVPRDAVNVPGALTVQVSASLTAGLGAAYRQFRPRADESNEDVADRVLAAAALHALPQSITGLSPAAYRHLPLAAALGVQKLMDHQLGDGGWPWFTSDFVWQSDPFVTADVVQAVTASREHGPLVRQSLTRARSYLHSQLSTVPAAERAHLLMVLAQSGEDPHHAAESLYADSIRHAHLDPGPLSDLGATLARARDGARARTVVAGLDAAAKVSATGAHWESSGWNYWSGPAIGSTSEVLSTLVTLSPHDPFVPAAVRWLMDARQSDGWDCGHDTAQAIAALAVYARAAREGTADYQYRVVLNAKTRVSGSYQPSAQRRVANLRVPISRLPRARASSLVIGRVPHRGAFGPGPLYYLMRMHYYLRANAIAPRSEGVSVGRRYLDLQGHTLSRVRAGAAVKVELTVHTDQSLFYLNVQDPLPGGLEPIDESLNTSQRGVFGQPQWQPYGAIQDLSWYLMHADLHDNRVSLYLYYLPPGTYRYTYLAQATIQGRYGVPPTHVSETFFPEVFGRAAGQVLTVQ